MTLLTPLKGPVLLIANAKMSGLQPMFTDANSCTSVSNLNANFSIPAEIKREIQSLGKDIGASSEELVRDRYAVQAIPTVETKGYDICQQNS